jgi:hypothetical protein
MASFSLKTTKKTFPIIKKPRFQGFLFTIKMTGSPSSLFDKFLILSALSFHSKRECSPEMVIFQAGGYGVFGAQNELKIGLAEGLHKTIVRRLVVIIGKQRRRSSAGHWFGDGSRLPPETDGRNAGPIRRWSGRAFDFPSKWRC